MIFHFVHFATEASEAEANKIAADSLPKFRAIPGLLQKYYLKLDQPGHYGGFYIWENRDALEAFRASDLGQSVPEGNVVVGEVMYPMFD